MSDDLMFVYGTLRKDTNSPMKPILDAYCDLKGEGWIMGRLYDLGRYPGVITETGADVPVHGQLFHLLDTAKVLKEFDYYEECSDDFPEPRLYRREKVTVHSKTGEPLEAWAYIYNHPVDVLIFIPGGDYITYLEETS